jgi:ketosteroid isomerase-like protein
MDRRRPAIRDPGPFPRPGRATFILSRRDARWLCVHSHVPLQPTQSASAHGRPGT